MKYFSGHKVHEHKLDRLVGRPVNFGIRGTTTYFIKELKSGQLPETLDLDNGKGLIQLFEHGILLRVFKSSRNHSIAISFDSLEKLSLIKGREMINPRMYSLFWILLKLGVSLDKARYFGGYWKEYRIDETELIIEAEDFHCRMTCSGYSFNSQERFFKALDKEEIEIKKN
jgi:hypothetical protein